MATLGTASILITADDRQLQSVLNRIPNLFARAGATAERAAVSAFTAAGAACGQAFTRSVRAESGTSRVTPPQTNTSGFEAAGTASGRAYARGIRAGGASAGTTIALPSSTSAFSAAGTASGGAFASSVAVGAIGVGGSLTNPVQGVTQAYQVAGVNSGSAFGAAIAGSATSIGANLTNPIASVAQAYRAAGTVGGGAFSTAVAQTTANVGAAVTAPVAATAAAFTSAGNIGGLNFTRGVGAGIAGVAASVVNPIASVTQAYSVAGTASGRTFSAGIAAGSAGITASITNPIQSIAQVFSAAGTASGNGFGIGLRSGTAGIGAGIGTQLASATAPAMSAGEQAGRAFSRGFTATARAGAGAVGGLFGAGRNLGNSARGSIGNAIGQSASFGVTQLAAGGVGAAVSTKNITEYDKQAERTLQVLNTGTDTPKALKKSLDENKRAALAISAELKGQTSLTEIQKALYEVGSSGLIGKGEVAKSRDIVIASEKLRISSSGELSSEQAIKLLTTQLNAFKGQGYKPKDAGYFASLLSGAADTGQINYSALPTTFAKNQAGAAIAGLSPEQYIALATKASLKGLSPGSLSAGFSGVTSALTKPTKAGKAEAEKLGIDFSLTGLQKNGPLEYFDKIGAAQNRLKLTQPQKAESLGRLFGGREGGRFAAALTQDPGKTKEIQGALKGADVNKNYNLYQTTIAAKQEQAQNKLVDLDIKLKSGLFGSSLISAMGIAVKGIDAMSAALDNVNKFYQSLSPEQKAFADNIGGVAVVVGGVAAAIVGAGVVIGLIGPPLVAAGALIGSFAVGLGSIALAAAPIVVPIAAVSAAVYGIAKAFGATDSQAFVAALSAAGAGVGLLFGPAIISAVVAGATAMTTSLAAIAVAAWAAAAPFLPFIAIGAAVVGALYLLYEAFKNPAVQKWARDTWAATGKFFNDFRVGLEKWGTDFASGVSNAFNGTIDFFKNGWKSIADTATGWISSSKTAIDSWGNNLSKGTTQAFDNTKGFFVTGWNSLAGTATSFVSGSSQTLSGWWSSTSAGFSGWFNSLNLSSAGSWDGLLNLGKRFVNFHNTIISNFWKTTVGYFGSMSAGVWNQLQKWFPWLTSVGNATNGLGNRIVAFKDSTIAAFNLTVRAGQSLGEGLSKYFNDVVASIKGMLDWVGQIPASFGRAIDSINIFKDKSSGVQSQPTPQPATQSTPQASPTQPTPSGQASYGEGAYGQKVPLRSSATPANKEVAFDASATGVIVASADLSGSGIDFTKSVSTSGNEFRSVVGQSIAQLQKVFAVSSYATSIVPTAKGAAYYNPPMEIQRPEATRNRRGKVEPHYGLDVPGRVGTPVQAAFDGEATYEKVSYQNNSGKTLTTGAITLKGIDAYGNKIALRYFHLGQETMSKAGQKMLVKAGDTIGAIGTDGKQGGNDYHVDLKARVNGIKLKDPRMLLQELVRQSENSMGKVMMPASRVGSTSQPVKATIDPIINTPKPQPKPQLQLKPQPQPKPAPILKAQYIEPITDIKTSGETKPNVNVETSPNRVEVSVDVNNSVEIPPTPDRPLVGGIVATPMSTQFPPLPQLTEAVKRSGDIQSGTLSTPPLPLIPTAAELKQYGSNSVVPVNVVKTPPQPQPVNKIEPAPTPQPRKTEPTVPTTVRVGASTYNPGGGGMEGPQKDVKGKKLTPNDKVVAIPGLANGGIKNTIPYGTIVIVTNPKTGLSSEATVRDAGPFAGAKNRQADLTTALAKSIKFSGVGQVDIKIVKLPSGFDPKGTYQIGDTKKFGSDKKSNITPGLSIGGPGVTESDIATQIESSTATTSVDARKLEDTKTRLDRAIADEERIKRIGVQKASGKKGTNKAAIQGRMNETYARQLETASRRREDAQKAYDRAQNKAETNTTSDASKAEIDALKNEFDRLQNLTALENAKTDKAVSDPTSGITTIIADKVKAQRSQEQFNALSPVLKAAQSLRQKYAGDREVTAQINQLEAAIYGIGKDANEGKTKVTAQTPEAVKDRVNATISNADKRDAAIENDRKLGNITQIDANDRLVASKEKKAQELAAQTEEIKSIKAGSTNKENIKALDELLATIDKEKADAIAALKEQIQNRFAASIDSTIEVGDKKISDVESERTIGNITSEEADNRILNIRIQTNNEIQKTIEGLLYIRSIAENSDEVKRTDTSIRKVNEYYVKATQSQKDFYTNSYSGQFNKIISVRDQRTTDVNQQAEQNLAPTNRDIEQQEKTLLIIRQQSTVELKKLREELEQYRNTLADADIKTREIVNEQVAKIRAIEVETAKATANADKSAVLLRNTTKSIATTGQESFRAMFLDAQNGFRNVGSIVDNLINKIADIGLNALFDKLSSGGGGGGGIGSSLGGLGWIGSAIGTVAGFLGFDRGGTVPNLGSAGSGAISIANYSSGGAVGMNKTIGKAFGIVGGLQAAIKREGPGGVPIVAKTGEEVLDIPNAKIYRNLVASGEWERVRQVNNYANGGTIGNVSNTPTMTNSARSGGNSSQDNFSSQRGSVTVDRINGIDYVTIEQMAAFFDIKMPQAAQAGAALSERNLSNTNYRQRNGLNNR